MESQNPKQSAHAKRRAKKQQAKKETEAPQKEYRPKNAEPAKKEEVKENSIDDNKVEAEKVYLQQVEDIIMNDDGVQQKSEALNPKKNARNGPKKGKGAHFGQDFKKPVFGNKEKTKQSNENGFKGDKDQWFDEALWKQPKHKFNFDNAKEHDYYFGSYSSHHIHEEMLKDTSRTLTYQRAIEGNPEDFKDKIVLDIGCGTGILSLFAAKAGAKHVYAVDNAEVALFAKEIVRQNGYEDKITVMKGKMEELEFPFGEGGVDIIISEWMGYFLLYESMLDCVLWARDKYLNKKTGKMLPDKCQMYVAAIEDSDYMHEKKTFWDNVYGFDMKCMSPSVFKDPVVDTVPSQQIMSDYCCILDLDLVTMKKEEVNFSNQWALNMNFTDRCHALVAWFDTSFSDLQRPVVLTTSPMKKYTHWKQSVFYLERPIDVRKGETLYGSVACKQDPNNFRELNIKISFHMDEQRIRHHSFQQYKFK